jgi:hypothetical protein
MTSSRTRVTTTVRRDNPVPRKRRAKSNGAVVLTVILIAIALLFARSIRRGPIQHPRPASVSR